MWKCKCGEMNPDSSTFCQSCGGNKTTSLIDEQKRQQMLEKARVQQAIQQEQLERDRAQQQHKEKIENLAKLGLDGYYEYKVLSLLDESGFFKKDSGRVDTTTMTKVLNELGIQGWHLVTAYSNELGKNALSGGAGGAIFGVNSTIDENILIFERFVKTK